MNILIPDSWLRDFIDTKAVPKQIADALSLHSASVENIEKINADSIYNIEITTNRVDMASVYGIAREAAAALLNSNIKAKLKPYTTKALPTQNSNKNYLNYLDVKITNTKLCSRFSTILYKAVENKESPNWIKDRLKKAGINPHNNIIDITNYVMLETGQPMHAFDYDKINNHTMILRESRKGEKIVTLDGIEQKLNKGDIVIEDGGKRLIDLCGLKGGKNTAIDKNTKNVLLFTQKYDPVRIRKTIQKTNLRTNAAALFEKGTDTQMTVIALQRAYDLLRQIAKAKLIGGIIDIYPAQYKPKKINLDVNLVKNIVGIDIQASKITNILKSLGFSILSTANNTLLIAIPSWRLEDINIPQDLVEEIVRIYGYKNIPSNIPPLTETLNQPAKNYFYWETEVKKILKHKGFNEIYAYSLTNKKTQIKIANPLTEDAQYLRTSLIPSLFDVISKNKDQTAELKIFELANIYLPAKTKNNMPIQKPMLALASSSLKLLELKQIIELVFIYMNIVNYEFVQQENQKAQILVDNKSIGTLSKQGLISYAQIDFKSLAESARKYKKYKPPSKFPSIIEDMTFKLPQKTNIGPIIDKIKSTSKLIKKVELHNTYKNNHTFRITYQSSKKSLASYDITDIRKTIRPN